MKSLIAVLLLSSSAYAADNRLALKLFANNTLTDIKVQGSDKDGKTGLGIGVEYLRQLTPRLALGVEIDNLGRSENVSGNYVSNVQGTVSGSVLAGLAVVRCDLSAPESKLRPYVSGGLGLAQVNLKASGVPNPGFNWATGGRAEKTVIDSSVIGGVFTLRGGADYALTERLSLGAEIGYFRTTEVEHELTPDGKALFGNTTLKGPQASFVIGSALAYRF